MKKFTVFVLTLVLAFSLPVTAFADTEINQNSSDPKTGSTMVSLQVDSTYTITIPAAVELNKTTDSDGTVTYTQTANITASEGLCLRANQNIQVMLESDFKLTTNDGTNTTLDYTVTAGKSTTPITSGGVAAIFGTSAAAQSQTLAFSANDPQYAGDYSDIVTFTVRVVTASSGS